MKLRVVFSSIAWLLSLPGMFFHVILATSALGSLFALPNYNSPTPYGDIWMSITFPLSLLAWPALAWMTLRWLADQTTHALVPVIGTALALGWLTPIPHAFMFLFLVAPTTILAIYLVAWHLWYGRQANNSLKPNSLRESA